MVNPNRQLNRPIPKGHTAKPVPTAISGVRSPEEQARNRRRSEAEQLRKEQAEQRKRLQESQEKRVSEIGGGKAIQEREAKKKQFVNTGFTQEQIGQNVSKKEAEIRQNETRIKLLTARDL